MLGGSPPGRTTARPPWPSLDLSHPHPPPAHQPAALDGFGRYGVYSLFPGDVYTHTAPGGGPRFAHTQPAPAPVPATAYHGLLPPPLKECVFSGFSPGGGTAYSAPVVERGISQLQELMAKGCNKPRLLEPPPPATPIPERRPKRRSWETTEIKQEGGARSSCACRTKTPIVPVSPGCSRTTPVTLKPAQPHGQQSGPLVLPQVKREPLATPCQVQVAEVTTSAVKVKQELPDPPSAHVGTPAVQPQTLNGTGGSSIPVGIAVARQRSQAQELRIKEDPTPVLPPPPIVPPLDQNLPFQPPLGYQLARDPISGQLLLISTGNNIADSLQRTIVWPNNTTSFPSSPLLLPQAQPMTGHLLLDRLVTLATPTPPPPPVVDKRRPQSHPHAHQHPLIKLEEPPLTGVMPCAKSSVVIQQLSTQQAATPILNPQFSAITSSGSVLIQHISGANPPAIIPPHNTPSVLISAQQLTTEAQSLTPSMVISHSQQDNTAAVITDLLGAHTQQLPLVIGTEPFPSQPPQIHLQIKESPKEEIEEIPESVQAELQIEPKIEPINGCRSQGTSPVACLSPGPVGVGDCASQSQSEDESCGVSQPAVQQADASNQTDSLPPSSDDEDIDTGGGQDVQMAPAPAPEPALVPAPAPVLALDPVTVPAPTTSVSRVQAVDLSGLELLSAASCQQIVRSHSAPLEETTKIKTEIEEEETEDTIPRELTPVPDLTIKEEVQPLDIDIEEEDGVEELSGSETLVDETEVLEAAVADDMAEPSADRSEPGIMGGLGLLCDVAHRFIEEEAAASRPQSPSDEQDKSPDPNPVKRGPGRPRKHSKRLSLSDGPSREKRPRSVSPAVSPPVLEPWSAVKCRTEGLPPPTLTPHKVGAGGLNKSAEIQQVVEWELVSPNKSPPPLSPAAAPAHSPSSASQKRKVGRPKKRVDHSSLTIVAKKPRSKSSLVGLLLAKKHLPESSNGHNKIKPKLKAEAKMKVWCDDEDVEWTATPTRRHSVASPSPSLSHTPGPARPVKSKSLPTPGSASTHKPHKKPIMVLAKRKRTLSTEQPPQKTSPQPITVQGVANCQLNNDHLSPGRLPCRVLVAMGGLFYAGQLSAVRPPDLYGVTLDGERGHRPHIHSREEILRDSILEVCTLKVPPPGTRVCAYWSQQYRCLYPGTVPTPSSVDDYDSRFVCVEFDDGDSGRISLEDIRLLPQDYPIVVYDPNPLQSLGKRRRRISGASCDSQTKDKPIQPMETISEGGDVAMEQEPENDGEMDAEGEGEGEAESGEETSRPMEPAVMDDLLPAQVVDTGTPAKVDMSLLSAEALQRERRRQKKKRKEKLRRLDSDKKHRHKHRDCLKSHRHKHKHRHHRHKHRHSKSIVTIENGALVEEKTPLTLVVHTKPPILSTIKIKKEKKRRERQGSAESRSKMAAFLPARQLWRWAGRSYKRPGAKGRARKDFYRTILRGNETISVGDCAVFLSTGRPDRPYIGRIESMWESWASSMVVKVKWFYHPEETVGCPEKLPYPGALFESPHNDENDVQTISHKCEVLPLDTYKDRLRLEPHRLATIYDYNDIYYLAGYYDPTTTALRFEPGVNV